MRRGPRPLCEQFGVVAAVFDPLTGKTHFLTELPLLLLGVIDDQPAGVQELIERLAGAVQLESDALEQVTVALASLDSAELVEPLTISTEPGRLSRH